MQAKASLTPIGTPVPELPVRDVARAQIHYRESLEKKPWGLTQFTVADLDGNRFHFHRD